MPERRLLWILFWGFFAAGFLLYTQHDRFPFYYHPDEPGKVGQLIRNKRNFHHPLLLLTSADLARRALLWGDEKNDPQRVVDVGRWVTAAWSALAVAALALLAARIHGMVAGVLVGAMILANSLLFELAHYLKEDPPFLAGIALALLALHHFREKFDQRSIFLLGGATALAAAGKYLGFTLLPVMALFVVGVRGSQAPWRLRMGWFLGSFALVWLAVNWWVIKSPELLWPSVREETNKVFVAEDGPLKAVPHAYYAAVELAYGSWALVVSAAVWLGLRLTGRMRVHAAEWVWFGLAAGFFLVFSFLPKTSQRYYLPIGVAVSYFGALGVWGLAQALPRLPRFAAALLGMLLALLPLQAEYEQTAARYTGFLADDPAALESFVRQHLPKSAVIAQDEGANLPEPERRTFEHAGRAPLRQRILGKKQVADLGTLAALRKQGVTHVVLCHRVYQRFLSAGDSPEKRFYETALTRGKILFSSDPAESGAITYLKPGLKLIDITAVE